MKQLLLSAALVACVHFSFAQGTAKGRVTDKNSGAPLSGASVTVNGKHYVTDADGNFQFECSGNARVTISFVGYGAERRVVQQCTVPVLVQLSPLPALLDEVEVTGSTQGRAALYQPGIQGRLAPRQLQRSTGLFLDDAINANLPGVIMQRRAVSSGQQFNIRGYGSGTRGTNGASSNFDIQGVKVYLNGIPLTDAEGITLLDDIDFGSIGSVDVTKGPAGTPYGLAIAGAVNLRTVKAEPGRTSVGQQVLLGNYGLQRYTTTLLHGTERGSILLNYGHQESDGAMLHNKSTKDFVNFVGEFQPNERQKLTTYFGWSNSFDQRAGELTITQYRNEDYSGNPVYLKNDAHSRVMSLRAGVVHDLRFNSRFSNSTMVYVSGMNTSASSAAGWTDKLPVNFGMRSSFNTRFGVGNTATLSGSTGVETQYQRSQTIGYAMVPDSANLAGYNRIGAERSNQAIKAATTTVFSEWTLALPVGWSVTAGLGWSNQMLDLEDRFFIAANNRPNNRPDTRFRKVYDGMWSPRFAVNKVFAGKVSAFASWSRGYKAPVSSYFYIPFVSGAPGTGMVNPNLRPEQGNQLELGTKGQLGDRVRFEAALFRTVFRNKMTNVAVPLNPTTTNYSYVTNGGRQVNRGFEAAVTVNAIQSPKGFIRQLAPFVNLSVIDARYRDFQFMRFRVGANSTKDSTVDFSGNRVAGQPPVTANIGFDLVTAPGIYFNAVYSWRDEVFLNGDNNPDQKADAFGILNSKIGFRHAFGRFDLDAYAGAMNLGGVQYYQMIFANQLPDAFLPAPRNTQWFGGINLKYAIR